MTKNTALRFEVLYNLPSGSVNWQGFNNTTIGGNITIYSQNVPYGQNRLAYAVYESDNDVDCGTMFHISWFNSLNQGARLWLMKHINLAGRECDCCKRQRSYWEEFDDETGKWEIKSQLEEF